jgi:hypothetical protein
MLEPEPPVVGGVPFKNDQRLASLVGHRKRGTSRALDNRPDALHSDPPSSGNMRTDTRSRLCDEVSERTAAHY